MRLICPNCGAQYEVPDDVIPDAGRDVQCSNCGQTWFQHHPDNDPDLTEELAQMPATPDPLAETPEPPAPQPQAAEQDAPLQRRSLDPSVADVLREEAEREARARASDQHPSLESQPDLGLQEPMDEAGKRAKQARDRMARMRGLTDTPDSTDPAPEATAASRKDLLPDIEEINSSLRSANAPRVSTADDHALTDGLEMTVSKSGGGFRRGFTLALLITAILWCLYLFAPQITAQIPQLEPLLTAYVAVVNQARSALDAQVQSLLTTLDGLVANTDQTGE